MTETWANYKSAIAAQPMPDEYKKDVEVLCYDCGKDSTAAFHFAAMECGQCGSFNTSQK
jgi:RING finger/CHY zinc finger protein 1